MPLGTDGETREQQQGDVRNVSPGDLEGCPFLSDGTPEPPTITSKDWECPASYGGGDDALSMIPESKSSLRPIRGKRRRILNWRCCGNPACPNVSMPPLQQGSGSAVPTPSGAREDGLVDAEHGPLWLDTHVHLDEVLIKIQVSEDVPSLRKPWDEMTDEEQQCWGILGLDRDSWTVPAPLSPEEEAGDGTWHKYTTSYGSVYYSNSKTGQMLWEWERGLATPADSDGAPGVRVPPEEDPSRSTALGIDCGSSEMGAPSDGGHRAAEAESLQKPLMCWLCGLEGHPKRLCPTAQGSGTDGRQGALEGEESKEADVVLPGDADGAVWQTCYTLYGTRYYWNRTTNEMTWERPGDFDGVSDGADSDEQDAAGAEESGYASVWKKPVPFWELEWEDLSQREQDAALAIGFTEGTWDQTCAPRVPNPDTVRQNFRMASFACITTGCDEQSTENVLLLHRALPLPPERMADALTPSSGSFPGFVWVELGCHPKTAAQFSLSSLEEAQACLEKFEARLKVVASEVGGRLIAWGEIGLDYSHPLFGTSKKNQWFQKEAFKRQIAIGLELGLPLKIHSRAAWRDTMVIMTELVPRDYRVHLHCFWDGKAAMEELFSAFPKAVIGFSNNIWYAGDSPEELCQCIPLENMVLETDAPYLPRTGAKMSTPGDIPAIGRRIAELRGVPVETVMEAVRQNVFRIYGI